MKLQLVLGNSGSGKTEYMYQKIVEEAANHPKKNYLVIVPEQFTMQTQRKLVDLSLNGAIMNIDVLSFKRLAYRVFDELGIRDMNILEETGKNLVLRKIAQEKEDKLTVLRPNMSRMGYISEVKSLLSELVQYNISAEQLRNYAKSEKPSPVLAAKLNDVVTMYEGFEAFMKERYITAEELLHVLRNVAEQSEILKDSVLVFDEFTGFTPIQNQLLYRLFTIVEKVWVSLTIDEEEDFYHSKGMQELFDMSKKTIQSLYRMAEELQVEKLETIVLHHPEEKRYKNAKALAFMEKNLFRLKSSKMEGLTDKEEKQIQIAAFKSPKDELINVARQINQLVQEEEYRYRDIAVVTGALDVYANYVDTVFGKYQIPYFIDKTKQIVFHPFIEWIRSVLEIVRTDFSYEAVFRFVRCGFCDLEEKKLDELENYLLATGLRGLSVWRKRWLRLPKGMEAEKLEELNQAREYLVDLLLPAVEAFKGKETTVQRQILAIYELGCKMNMEELLWKKEQQCMDENQQVKAKEYGQIYRIVMELFEKYVNLLGEEHLTIQEFEEILDAGLDAAEVATIPPELDCVTIGDIERTRLSQIKVLFFVGVNDGVIPKSANQGGIISQYERELLKEMDIELAPGAREQTFIQRFYLYLNMTKPSDALYLSYAKVDADGKAIRPSYLINMIRRMFPGIQIQEYEEMRKLLDVSTMDAAKEYLVHGERNETWYELAKWFWENDKEVVNQLLDAAYVQYADEPISRVVAQAVYGTHVEGSVTRLEQFARCAYSHFLTYGLLLRERQISGFANVDIGNIYHDALSRYSFKLEKSSKNWFTVDEEERSSLASMAFSEAVEAYPDLSVYATAENKHVVERMGHIFDQTVWALTKQVRKGTFVPSAFELTFEKGGEHQNGLHFTFEHKEQIDLTGRIDRMDTCVDDGRIYVKVIDYKSGNTKFDLLKLYQGVQLQLVVYMNAAMNLNKEKHPNRSVLPGGLLYYHIDDPVIEAEGNLSEEEVKQLIFEQLRPDGLVNEEEAIYRSMDQEFEKKSDVIPVTLKKDGTLSSTSHVASTEEFDILSEYAKNQIQMLGQKMYDGKVSIEPLMIAGMDSCTYCSYASICRINSRLPGISKRTCTNGSKEDILEQMKTVNAKQEAKRNHGSEMDR